MTLSPVNKTFIEISELEIIKHRFIIQLVKKHGENFPAHVDLMKNLFDYINFHIARRKDDMVAYAENKTPVMATPLDEIQRHLRNLGVDL